MAIVADIQSLNPSGIVELFELDTTMIVDDTGAPGILYRFHSGTNEFTNNVVWNANTYTAFPIDASGFELSTTGSLPRPTLKIANITGLVGAITRTFSDLIGAKLTRKRTLIKYLDAANFTAGNALADPTQFFPDDIFFINRKTAENRVFVEFELASVMDLHGVKIPRRQIIQNTCTWVYRGSACSFAGGAVAKANDQTTTILAEDVCGKRLTSCRLRFPGSVSIPYGGFPGAGKF